MPLPDADNASSQAVPSSPAVFESIVRDIVKSCKMQQREDDTPVSDALAAYLIKCLLIDPRHKMDTSDMLSKEQVQEIVTLCTEKLLDRETIDMHTISMQVYFTTNYAREADLLEAHRNAIAERLDPVLRDITDSRARSASETEVLYQKIVGYILLRSHLGDATDLNVVRETAAALESVFPRAELTTFMSLLKKDKELQINDLTSIVIGIRLFNRSLGKGGHGITDVPEYLLTTLPGVVSAVAGNIKTAETLTEKYRAIMQQGIKLCGSNTVQAHLVNILQCRKYLGILQEEVAQAIRTSTSKRERIQQRIDSLKDTVKSKTAVPTDHVYPQFISVANIWNSLQDELILMNVRNDILALITTKMQLHWKRDECRADELIMLNGIQAYAGDQRDTNHKIEKGSIADASVLYPDTTPNFEHLPVEFAGFCPMSILEDRDLFLVPGVQTMGIVQKDSRFYSFATVEAAKQFAADPARVLIEIHEIVKTTPALIQLLDLETNYTRDNGGSIAKVVTKCDGGTQTETHPVESHIDKNYTWNEWDMRRTALRIVNLRNKVTHSAQTDLSNFRRENETQIYQQRNKETQVKKSSSTSMPVPVPYITGLRNKDPKVSPKVVTLTLDTSST